jgi:hypothetical protein
MAVSRRFALLVAGYLSLFGATAGGCRTVGLCAAEECVSEGEQVGGTATGGAGSAGRAAAGATPNQVDAEDGSGGELGAAGAAGAPGAPNALVCAPNLADCDHSRLTGCESDLTWNVRHCGGCGELCDGLCLGGRCEETRLVSASYATSMVASISTGFALVTDGFTRSLLIVDIQTAAADVLVSDVDSEAVLAASADRVYLLDPTNHVLQSARLDGSDLQTEDVAWPVSVGGTAKGAYYVNILTHPETEDEDDEYQLYFRAKSSQSWQLLYQGSQRCKVLSSSSFGMVLARYADDYAEDADAELSLFDGNTEQALGHAPPGFLEAAAVSDGYVVALTEDPETSRAQLWWLKKDEAPVHYEVTMPSNNTAPDLNVWADSVVLYFENDGRAFVQLFSVGGPDVDRYGIIPVSNVVWVDRRHVWYGVYDDWVTTRFLRSTWLDLKF